MTVRRGLPTKGNGMSLEYRIGDVFERLAEIPDGSIDLIVTSPPFLALRSYLPADHEHKHREIGSEATPAAFLDTLLALTAEWGRVLAPHGSLCVELGDTYASDQGRGAAWTAGGERFTDAGLQRDQMDPTTWRRMATVSKYGNGWPLAKSLTGIPTLYPWSLAYGRNLLRRGLDVHELIDVMAWWMRDGWTVDEAAAMAHAWADSAGRQDGGATFAPWRIRNVIVWARPNPPVGALGDKFRPATSYITVACRGARRYFDLDAVRTLSDLPATAGGNMDPRNKRDDDWRRGHKPESGGVTNPAGAPPLDWHTDHHPEDGDWLWRMATAPYKNSHYATYPYALPKRLIEAMCPLRVCTVCGRPSERITGETTYQRKGEECAPDAANSARTPESRRNSIGHSVAVVPTLGWSDCGHDAWRTGVVLDPFAGSGTTLEAAQAVGRHAIGFDLDGRNAELARQRIGMFLETREADEVVDNTQIPGQMEMFG